jgi:uncharacterized protein (TIGR02246 family)
VNFRQTLDRHLHAIQNRDLPALLDTLPPDRLTLIMSDGRLVRSVDEFREMHQCWFASDTWKLGAEIVRLVEGTDVGLAVVHLDYRDQPSGGASIHETSYLTLAFQKQGDRWLMVHDQNTPVKKRAT